MKLTSLQPRRLKLGGYPGALVSMTVEEEFLDREKYRLFASQFQLHSDRDGSWRGEFWGKFVRGACQCYRIAGNPKLYQIIEESVLEMTSFLEPDGTLSSYIPEQRLTGWDLWSRKYAMIGMLSYCSISHSKSKKAKVLSSVKRQANAIMDCVGRGEGKKGILETSNSYGALNSASILGVYVDLHFLTGIKKYLSFARYIVSSGLCQGEDLVENAFKEGSYPYQWKSKKAYEMIVCYQGLLHYGWATGEEKYIRCVEAFVSKVVESEFTITGGIGTVSEFFSNSVDNQTEIPCKPGLETCVTVMFMSLCDDLLKSTGNPHYADLLETMSYNAMLGSCNDQHQSMNLAEGRIWRLDGYDAPPHEPYFFDSYSPLVKSRRATVVGGYMRLQNDHSYGCCAANGGYGLGLIGDFAFLKGEDSYCVNLYSDFKASDIVEGKKVLFSLRANLYRSGSARLSVQGQGRRFRLYFRLPSWGEVSLRLNGEPLEMETTPEGYGFIDRVWGKDTISIMLPLRMEMLHCHEKVAFKRGPIVLSADARYEDLSEPISAFKKGKLVKDETFPCQETILFLDGLRLCDYSSAAKNMDDPNAGLSVWMSQKA